MHTIGLDIGGTTIKGGLVDRNGRVLRSAARPTDASDIGKLVGTLENLVGHLSRNDPVGAVGVGVPGLRSSDTGETVVSPNVACLAGVNVEAVLGDRVAPPVVSRNDADMSAWGELCAGAGIGTRYMVCLTLGTGVGSGIILGGRLYNGSRGYASEAGHLVVDPEGLPCSCGSRGCLEAVASATGIVALARAWLGPGEREAVPEPWTAAGLYEAARAGHKASRTVFEQAGRYLGIACASLINVLNPEAIVLAGGVMEAGDMILAPAVREARLRAFDASFGACRIVRAKLGTDAGVVGAALFAAHVAG